MKVKIALKETFKLKRHQSTKEDELIYKQRTMKNDDISDAVQWCEENNKHGYAALKTGLFPSIKDARTINAYLDGKREVGAQNRYQNIMTKNEEDIFVRYLANKNRCCQGLTEKAASDVGINILRARIAINKQKGRKFIPLSWQAKNAVANNELGRRYFQRLKIDHPGLIMKKPKAMEINRGLNITREMAENHLDGFPNEINQAGIGTLTYEAPGVWTGKIDDTRRIIFHDETPQMLNHGPNVFSRAKVFGTKGEPANKLLKVNRDCITVQPFSNLAGDHVMCQMIFSGSGIHSHMATEESARDIKNLLISVNQSGCSDGKTLLEAYKVLDESLRKEDVPRPVIVTSDGHGSRFDFNVLNFLHENLMWLYILYPDTSGATQMHDQLNAQIHRVYELEKAILYSNFAPIDREAFMQIMAPAWSQWASPQQLTAAAKRVGITAASGVNVNWMQQEKFQMSENILHPPTAAEATPFAPKSPHHARSGSAKSLQAKLAQAMAQIRTLEKMPPIERIEGLLPYQQIQPKKKTKNRRITQEHGSMRAVDMLTKVAELMQNEEEKKEKKLNAAAIKQAKIDNFHLCREKCACEAKPCRAKHLKMCSICSDVLLSQCNKVKCREAAAATGMKAPAMIHPSSATSRKPKEADDESESVSDDDTSSEEGGEMEDESSLSDDEDFVDFVRKQKKRKLPPRKLASAFSPDETREKSIDESVLAEEITEDDQAVTFIEDSPGPSNDNLENIVINQVKPGDWVKVRYEEQTYIGLVQEAEGKGKQKKEFVRVRCLEKPYPVRELQELERINDACDFKEVYYCEEKPHLVKEGRAWKYIY